MPIDKFTLKVVKGKPAAQTFEFSQEEVHIGSAYAQSDLVVNTEGIAPRHARIWRFDGDYFIQNLCDFQLSIGQDSPLDKNASSGLQSGTNIDMGSVVLRFVDKNARRGPGKGKHRNGKRAKGPVRRKTLFGAIGIVGILFIVIAIANKGGQNLKGGRRSRAETEIAPIELPAKGKYGYNKMDKDHLDKTVFIFRSDASNVELYYTPGHIDSDKEVSILLNGKPVGFVPQTKKEWGERTSVRLPTTLLRKEKEEDNRLVFDNMKNPPGFDQWGVKNVGIRDMPENLCDKAKARKLFDLGDEMYQQKTISKANLYSAHKYYCDSTERMQDCEDKDAFHRQVLAKKEAIGQELTAMYNSLNFSYRKYLSVKDYGNCVGVLKDIMAYFPDESSKRHQSAAKMLEKFNFFTNRKRR